MPIPSSPKVCDKNTLKKKPIRRLKNPASVKISVPVKKGLFFLMNILEICFDNYMYWGLLTEPSGSAIV